MATLVDLDELRGFGWSLWDPLGLDGVAPRDEYDSYLLGLVGIIRNGGSAAEGEAYLARIEAEWLGVMNAAPCARAALVSAVRSFLDRFPAERLKLR